MTDPDTSPALTEDQSLHFRDALPGFPACHRFSLSQLADDSPLRMLSCDDDPQVQLIVSSPWVFFPDYAFDLPSEDQEDLDLQSSEETVVFCTVSLDPDSEEIAMNLLAPFVVNSRTREGRQVVLHDSQLPLRAVIAMEGSGEA